MQLKPVLSVFLLLFLGHATPSRSLQNQDGNRTKQYKTLWDAVAKEAWFVRSLSGGGGGLPSTPNLLEWAGSPEFALVRALAYNPRTKATVFLPGPVEAYQKQAAAHCLTFQAWYNKMASQPALPADYIRAMIVPSQALNSSRFWDGATLRTAQPAVRLVLGMRKLPGGNGTMQWVLRNASAIKKPGHAYTYEDVGIIPGGMDISAGDAYVHLTDSPIRVDKHEPMWAKTRAEVLRSAGLPVNSTTCPNLTSVPSKSGGQSSSQNRVATLVVSAAVPAGIMTISLCTALLWWARRKRQCCSQQNSGEKPAGPADAARQLHLSSHAGGGADAAIDVSSWPAQPPRSAAGSGRTSGSHVVVPLGGSTDPSTSASNSSLGTLNVSSVGDLGCAAPRLASHGSQLFRSPFALSNPAAPGSTSNSTAGWASRQQGWGGSRSGSGSSGSGSPGIMMSIRGAESSQVPGPHITGVTDSSVAPPAQQASRALPTTAGTAWLLPTWRTLQQAYAHLTGRVPTSTQAAPALCVDPSAPSGSAHTSAPSKRGGLELIGSVPIGLVPSGLVLQLSDLLLEEQPIGEGAEGKVYRGTWKHSDIAAKEFLPHLPTDSQERQDALATEVDFMSKLKHPNLVTFFGVCLERPMVVMEFCNRGSVFDILRKAERELKGTSVPAQQHSTLQELTWERRLTMLHDVAAGMCYLHGHHNQQHIHGDLRSPNLFVGADGKVKIGDFGFTKRLACNERSLTVDRITHPRWVAPELLNNVQKPASDVYSFGVIMYELLTFKIPFEGLNKEQVVFGVLKGLRPEIPPDTALPPGTSTGPCLQAYIRLMQECWSHEDAQRPTFETIARTLKAMQDSDRAAGTRRLRSMPDMYQAPSADSAADARRVISAPAAASAAASLRQQWQAQQQQQRRQQQPAEPPAPAAALSNQGDDMSSCVYSAVVQGTRLTVISTRANVAEQDALRLASDQHQEQIAAAQRVLVVASDLPSCHRA